MTTAKPLTNGNHDEYKRLNVVIVGGSLGGLTAGVALKHAGHKTTILERNPTPLLQNQGAGIVAGGDTLRYFEKYDRCNRAFQCPSYKRIYLGLDGQIEHQVEMRQNMTSWDLAYFVLRANYDGFKSEYCEIPETKSTDGEAVYRYGSNVTDIQDEGSKGIRVLYESQGEAASHATRETITADLVIACDGPSSKIRSLFHPEVKRTMVGYCALRGTVPENEVSEEARDKFVERFAFYHGPGSHDGGTQILAYIIPGPNGNVTPGERLVNFVWYMNFPENSQEFEDLMTDKDGTRHRLTLPPGKMSEHVWKKQVSWAKNNLPPQFYEIIEKTQKPFAQAVTDAITPTNNFCDGRVLLVGDALANFRPHTVMSTSQAAFDAMLVDDYLRGKIDYKEFRVQTIQYARYMQARGVRMGNRSQFGEDGKLVPLEGHIKDRDIASTPRDQECFPAWTREGIA